MTLLFAMLDILLNFWHLDDGLEKIDVDGGPKEELPLLSEKFLLALVHMLMLCLGSLCCSKSNDSQEIL